MAWVARHARYPSDTSDEQWALIEPLLPQSCADTASTTNPGRPNIAAAALRSRSTWGPLLSVFLTPRIMRPQARLRAQAEDRVLQRRTTLRDEEPANIPVDTTSRQVFTHVRDDAQTGCPIPARARRTFGPCR